MNHQANKWNRIDWMLSVSLLVINIAIKLIYISVPEIGGDEPFTLFYANADLETYFNVLVHENNPPLFTLLLKGWISIFGSSILSVRMLPLLFSSFTAVGIYALSKRFFTRETGMLAALLFSFSTYHIYFAHDARVYSLFALLTVLSMLSFLKLTLEQNKKQRGLLTLFNTLLIYSHFFGFFVLFVQFVASLTIAKIWKNTLKQLLLSWGITAVLYIPYIPILIQRFSSSSNGTWVDKPTIEALYTNLWEFSNQPVNTVIFILILLSGSIVYLFRERRKELSDAKKITIIWFALSYLLMFGLSFIVPMFLDRYLVFISIAFYILIATAILSFTSNKIFNYVGIGVLSIMMLFTCDFKAGNDRKHSQSYGELKQLNNSETAILICPEWHFYLFSYHYDKDIFLDYKHTILRLNNEDVYLLNSLNEELKTTISSKKKIIYVDAWDDLVDPEQTILSYLKANFQLTQEKFESEGNHLYFFTNHKL